jgi:hypothetical protein
MNDEIFDIDVDIDMKVWDDASNVIEPISFHRFHGPSNWLAYSLWGRISFIHSYKLLLCKGRLCFHVSGYMVTFSRLTGTDWARYVAFFGGSRV